MKIYLLGILLLITQITHSQIVFEGIDVLDFSSESDGWLKLKEGEYRYSLHGKKFEKIGHFDQVNKILDKKRADVKFVCKKPNEVIFEEAYQKLVELLGKETKNQDYIPEEAQGNWILIARLIKKGKAEVNREWIIENHSVQVNLLWQKKIGINVIFSKDFGGER